jgi:hypothetical protein
MKPHTKPTGLFRSAERTALWVSLAVLACMTVLLIAVLRGPAYGQSSGPHSGSRGRMRSFKDNPRIVIWIPTPGGLPVPMLWP